MRTGTIRIGSSSLFALLALAAGVAQADPLCGNDVAGYQVLTHDLSCDGPGPAVVLLGGAVLNLNGFAIHCTGELRGTGIRLRDARATAMNGSVTGCSVGVELAGDGRHLVQSMGATDDRVGFLVQPGSTANRLVRNHASGGMDAFVVRGDGNDLFGNSTTGGRAGMVVDGASNTIANNRLGPTNEALALNGAGNHVRDNAIEGQIYGVVVRGSRTELLGNHISGAALVAGVAVADTASSGAYVSNTVVDCLAGFRILGSSSFISANRVARNGVGISLGAGATHDVVRGNLALENTAYDLQDDNSECGSNLWQANTFGTANQGCIH